MNRMFLKMVLSSTFRRKSRMLVAILAIAIGATILSGLVTIYYDIPRQLGKEFRSYGANLIVLPKNDKKISSKNLDKIKEVVGKEKIVGMAPYKYHTTKINEQPYMLAGTDLVQAKKNSPFWYIEGDWIDNKVQDTAMIGKEISTKHELNVGDTFVVQGVKYGRSANASSQDKDAQANKDKDVGEKFFTKKLKVGGIITTGGYEEEFIFLNIDQLAKIIDSDNSSDIIECSIEADQDQLNSYAQTIGSKIDGVSARPVKRVTQSQDVVLGKLQALVYLVTIVVLIITMISVATTMMAMVAERKKEIGLKKALGAENSLIVKEFLGEASMLGILGGALGVFLGFVFAQRVSLSVFGRAIEFQWGLIPITILVSVLITALASIWPIRKVLDIHPAIVLKGE